MCYCDRLRSAFNRCVFVVLAGLICPGVAAAKTKAEFVVRTASVAPEGTPWERQIKRTRKHIHKESDGRVKIKLYLGGKKGDEKSIVRQCRDGRIELMGVSTASIATLVPALQVLEIPFLFESAEEADYVLDHYLYEPTKALLAKHGFVLYQWAENGWQNFGSKKGYVKSPSDLRGLKMRSQESAIHLLSWKTLGAAPVEIAVSEVLPALKTGLVDGFAQTALFTFAAGWHQGVTHYTVSRHTYQPAALVYSKKFFDTLPPELRAVMLGHVEKDTELSRQDVRKIEPGLIENFRRYGIHVYELSPAERKAFSVQGKRIYDAFAKQASSEAKALLAKILAGKEAYAKRK